MKIPAWICLGLIWFILIRNMSWPPFSRQSFDVSNTPINYKCAKKSIVFFNNDSAALLTFYFFSTYSIILYISTPFHKTSHITFSDQLIWWHFKCDSAKVQKEKCFALWSILSRIITLFGSAPNTLTDTAPLGGQKSTYYPKCENIAQCCTWWLIFEPKTGKRISTRNRVKIVQKIAFFLRNLKVGIS